MPTYLYTGNSPITSAEVGNIPTGPFVFSFPTTPKVVTDNPSLFSVVFEDLPILADVLAQSLDDRVKAEISNRILTTAEAASLSSEQLKQLGIWREVDAGGRIMLMVWNGAQRAGSGGAPRTTAQLKALTAEQSALLQMCICTDCLTPYGAGGLVFWDANSAVWRLSDSRIEITTNALQFYRSAFDINYTGGRSDRCVLANTNAYNADWYEANVSGGGYTRNILISDKASWKAFNTSTSATGGVHTRGVYLPRKDRMTSCYTAIEGCLSALSASGEEFQFRLGFDRMTAAINTDFVGLVNDRGNVLGVNAGNLNTIFSLRRAASSSQGTNTGVTPSINTLYPDLLEVYVETNPDQVTMFVNGVEVTGSPFTANLPAVNVLLNPQFTLLKSAGTTAREFRFTRYGYGFRYAQ